MLENEIDLHVIQKKSEKNWWIGERNWPTWPQRQLIGSLFGSLVSGYRGPPVRGPSSSCEPDSVDWVKILPRNWFNLYYRQSVCCSLWFPLIPFDSRWFAGIFKIYLNLIFLELRHHWDNISCSGGGCWPSEYLKESSTIPGMPTTSLGWQQYSKICTRTEKKCAALWLAAADQEAAGWQQCRKCRLSLGWKGRFISDYIWTTKNIGLIWILPTTSPRSHWITFHTTLHGWKSKWTFNFNWSLRL